MKIVYSLSIFLALCCLSTFYGCDNLLSDDRLPNVFDEDSQNVFTEHARDSVKTEKESSSFEDLVATYENKNRVFWQKPDLIIDRMGDISTKTVADIGAGSGYFARRLAHKAKKVIAVDIDERFIEFMDSIKLVELPSELQGRFVTRLATPKDSNLDESEADIIILVNTYIYIADPVPYLDHLRTRLSPSGKVVIVDFKKKRIPISNPPASLRVPLYKVENALDAAGYKKIESDDTSLDYQYIVVASPTE